MSDDRDRVPVFKRARTQDRDVYVSKATPPSGTPEFVSEDCTGRYEGEELLRARERRPTPERLRILEHKHDALNSRVSEIHVGVSKMGGQMDVLLKHILPDRVEEQKTERVRLNTRAKVIIAFIGAVCTVAGYLLAGCA